MIVDDRVNKERPRVLVVDDDFTTLQLAEDMLTGEGFDVITTDDGESALSIFKEANRQGQHIDIVLLDVEMPGLDGYQVCEQLRATPEGEYLPIIIITGREDIAAAQRAFDVLATDFGTKPTHWLVLAQRMRYTLRAAEAFNEVKHSQQRLADAQIAAKLRYWEYDITEERFYLLESTGMNVLQKGQNYTLESLLAHCHPADRSAVEKFNKTLVASLNPESHSVEFRLLAQGEAFRVFLSQGRADFNNLDANNRPKKLIGVTQDITDIRFNEERIQRLAHYDELTGLHNRESFQEKLDIALQLNRASESKLAVFHIDMDNFKRINDSFGYDAGDALIQEFVRRLRVSDVIAEEAGHRSLARFGGDEFTLMLACAAETAKMWTSRVALQIKETLTSPFYIGAENEDEKQVFISASIGISIYPDDGNTAAELLKNANTALHVAKYNGKSQHQFYTDSMSAMGRVRLDLEVELRRAIDQQELELYYQPQISAKTGDIVGVEALVRWNHPKRGMISPAEFIPFAEENGLILPMSDWIMTEACRQAKAWSDSGLLPLVVSINLSGLQFKQDNFEQTVQQIFEQTGVDPKQIGFELTESIVMGNAEYTIATLKALKNLGVKLSVDDFGTGYSSLSYLQKFPLDTLKIDRSFIQDINEDFDDAAIAEAIIVMGHSLGLQIIAEGVETQAQLDFLSTKSCEVIQGFFFSRPLPAAEIPAFVAKNTHLKP